jgi:YVTN family beta-propeller protein
VGTANADGILLPTGQRINPAGTRILVNQGRLLSSAISPNGKYLAALSWNEFTGFLTIINLETGRIIQQVGAYPSPAMGDGSVAADGPLWSADGTSLWVPQSYELLHFTVRPNGMVAPNPVTITLEESLGNLTTGNSYTYDLPSGMALSSDGTKLYVAFNGVNQLGVIDTATNQLLQEIPVGNAPRQVVLVGNVAYVSNEGGRPAKPGDFTNESYGTAIVSSKVTGAATTGTVSVVNLLTGAEVKEIPVGLEPTAEYLAPNGVLMVANSNDDSMSFINTATNKVVQTVNVNPLPGSTVGSYPNAISMPNPDTVLVSIGRDNALAVYNYVNATTPVSYEGLIPTDFYPVNAVLDPALDEIVVTNDKGIGARGPKSTICKDAGTSPAPDCVTGHNTYDDTGSVTTFAMPTMAQLATDTSEVFLDNNWDHLLASTPISNPTAKPVAIPSQLGDPSTIKHVFLIIRENRTYDQELGDIGKGNSDPALAQFGAPITPNAHAIADQFGLFDNFYDEGTLSADGHNWIVQADANDYIEKEFGAFYRSYPAQGGDALAYQRDGFLWNAAEAVGDTVQNFGEYNNYVNQEYPVPSWSEYYQDSQILEGQAGGPLPVPESSVYTYPDIPSLNSINYTEYPPFDLGIPDQYRADVWEQAFAQSEATGQLANLTLIWLPDDHTSAPGEGIPNPVSEVADNDLALGRIVDTISHSSFWPTSAIFVMEDDSQNGTDHVDGHRAPMFLISPYAKRGIVDGAYYTQLNVVKTVEQILGIPPMNQEDRASEPMFGAFTNKPDLAPYDVVPNQISLTEGLTPSGTSESPAQLGVPASEQRVYDAWVKWGQSGRFAGAHPIVDYANPAQLNRLDWYSSHNWTVPYPGDKAILYPSQVPGANLPADYLGD